MKKGGFMKDALVLCAITVIAGGALGGVYELTKEPIAAANLAAKEAAYQVVLSEATSFEAGTDTALLETVNAEAGSLGFGNVTVDEYATGVDGSGAVKGYVVTTSSKDGYGGQITVSVGILPDGTVSGVEFLTLAETAGLGMNAAKPDWKGQYADKNVDEFTVTKSGATKDNEIDAIGGATITSSAVTGAVNMAINFAKNQLAK